MSDVQLQREETVIKATIPKYPVFFKPETIPWTEWAMPGTWFKLLYLNDTQGSFTILLKVDPDNEAPIHRHTAAVEAYVIEGEFGYGNDRGGVGSYAYEPSGATHEPTSPGGVIMFAIIHGPILGYNPDGSIAGVIDNDFMYDAAMANNAAGHIRRDL